LNATIGRIRTCLDDRPLAPDAATMVNGLMHPTSLSQQAVRTDDPQEATAPAPGLPEASVR